MIVMARDDSLFHKCLDVLFDVRNLGRKSGPNLGDDFFHKMDVLELLASLHDTHNNGL